MLISPSEKGLRATVAPLRREGGFTLIETAIALCIMMVAALAVAALFVYALNYNSGAGDRALALAIAQQRMERLRRTPFTDDSLSAPSTTEAVTNAGRQYTVVTTICSSSDCGGSSVLKVITIQVTPQSANGSWASAPATLIAERSAPAPGPYER
jgi:type II secretion system protein I